jgi:bifunctional DNA-binding transcriptional regulator/antitoxin component of YhaV-PrlF toxin-antitoxin module
VTSKLQVTVPKEIADRYDIRPGSEIDWIPAGDTLRVVPAASHTSAVTPAERLRVFDEASARQKRRQAKHSVSRARDRGWKREELYARGVSR